MAFTTSVTTPIRPGSQLILICTVMLNSTVVECDLPLLVVEVQFFRYGIPAATQNGGTLVNGTTFIYKAEINSFERNDSGDYTCTARVTSNSSHLVNSHNVMSSYIKVLTG